MVDDAAESTTPTPWHRFLGKALELSVGLERIQVLSEVEISAKPPRIDVLLLRRETEEWTKAQRAMLPDGVRDTAAKHILLEFKYSESLTQDAIVQALAYEHFYRTSRGLKRDEVQMFILCAKTPQEKRLSAFEYGHTDVSGICGSANIYVAHIQILILNQLEDEPYNALVKTFASRMPEKNKAFNLLRQFWTLSSDLSTLLEALRIAWSLPEGAIMDSIFTPERVLEMGEIWKQTLLESLSDDELESYINPTYKKKVLNQGIEQGIEQGVEQKNREIVARMHAQNYELAVIADLTRLTLEEIAAILQEGAVEDGASDNSSKSDDADNKTSGDKAS